MPVRYTFILGLLFCASASAVEVESRVCVLPNAPPPEVDYSVRGDIKASKGSYGGVDDVLPTLVAEARQRGADGIIDYHASQHFGFWPWRVVHPVAEGTAVKWVDPSKVDCVKLGGFYR